MRRAIGWVVGLAVSLAMVALWSARERAAETHAAVVFSPARGCEIVIPRDAIEAERRAARMLQDTLGKASGRGSRAFPIVAEDAARGNGGVWLGRTKRRPRFLGQPARAPFDTTVGYEVVGGAVVLRGERRESAEIAASWFLRTLLDAHWFIPGPLGEVVPARDELRLPAGRTIARPEFLSRDLNVGGSGADGDEWYARNGLERRFHHGHNLDKIFKPEDLRAKPEMAPMLDDRRYLPAPGRYNWQPDMTSPAAIEHAAAVANRAFAEDPERISFSLSANDTVRFDESVRTLEVVAPPRFFRERPDYSDLVFQFTNRVAERVARVHPDRWLPAYAYYWAENTPRFPVAKNVVPYLTADRAQWFDPEFAAEDRALIERWTRSGAEIVGAYDYYYGRPYLIPRPIVTAVKESIPFMHGAGVRAFYAEMSPNWAIDGPKAWLAAQLLWDPKRDPAELLDIYYRDFWAEAAEPMRAFFDECERAWVEQPRPGYWIKYFREDHQALLFPPERRAALRAALAEAVGRARAPAVQARVAFVAAGWDVTEAFLALGDARDELGRHVRAKDAAAAAETWRRYVEAHETLAGKYAAIQTAEPLAMAPQNLDFFLRNDPRGRAVRFFAESEPNRKFLEAHPELLPAGATGVQLARLFDAPEMLQDADWELVRPKPIGGSADFEPLELGGPWGGDGEPSEHRRVRWLTNPEGAKTLRFDGCLEEFLAQWVPTTPGALYVAQINVRAKVSPGNQTFLIVNFSGDEPKRLGVGVIDRLPVDAATQEARLCVIVRAPENARFIGMGLRVLHQVNDDFAEFSGASLRRLEE